MAATHKAQFCLGLGIAPSEYDQLTQYEIRAFADEHERRVKEERRR